MLGVRRYQKVQVDLWCGNPHEFVIDESFELSPSVLSSLAKKDYAGKHLGLVVGLNPEPSKLMSQIKTTIESWDSRNRPRRLTVMTSDLEIYKALREHLYVTFPD